LYYNFYDPLPKFNKSTNSGISKNVNKVHASVISDIDKATPDGTSVRTANVKKSSAAMNAKLHAKRTQQVWVLKNSN
jgi:hypothetical protein